MLSYQHAYHAGNFADCHKHAVLCALLAALQTKDSGLTFYDFFAGRGMYALASPEANKTSEYTNGIAKIWPARATAPDVLKPYLDAIAVDNVNGDLKLYPGSPALLKRALRLQDRLICNDAHPQEHDALQTVLRDRLGLDPRIAIHQRDAWEAMQALIPPRGEEQGGVKKTPRGLVVLDPAYEVKSDYTILVEACAWALKKFSHGLYLIWYPLLPAGHHQAMLDLFQKYIPTKTLHSQLLIQSPHTAHGERQGMYGSGLLIINPPWQFENTINEISEFLVLHLGQDQTAQYTCDWLVAET